MNTNSTTVAMLGKSQALACMNLLIAMEPADLEAPDGVKEAVTSFELSMSPVDARTIRQLDRAGRYALADLRIALAGWLTADRAACVALLGSVIR